MENKTNEQITNYIDLILDRVDTMRDWLPSHTPARFDLFFALLKSKLTKPQLEKLLHSNEPSFGHDVFGIHKHTDITKGLDKTFVPRCTCGNDFY